MTPTPHDALVRAIFREPERAADLVRAALAPGQLAALRLATLAPAADSFIDPELRESNADLLFTVELAQPGRHAFVLLEHQSTLDPQMAWRLLGYQLRLWERCRRERPDDPDLPPILPIVLHQGLRHWSAARRFSGLLGLDSATRAALGDGLLDFHYAVDDLATQSDEQLLARDAGAMTRLVLLALRNSRSHPRLHELLAAHLHTLQDQLQPARDAPDLILLERYVLEVEEIDPATVRAAFTAALRPELRSSDMPTAADRLRAEGRVEGDAAARRDDVLELLTLKFGPVDAATRRRVEQAASPQLKTWHRRIVVASTLADVFAD